MTPRRAHRFFLAILCVGALVGFATPASAQKAAAAAAATTVSEWAYRKLNRAQELLGQNKPKEALVVMEEMAKRQRLNDHERALMWQTFGFIYSAQERYKEAAKAFEESLALNALPPGAALNTEFNLGQLYLTLGEDKRAVQVLSAWFKKAENPAPSAYYTMAMAYTRAKDLRTALTYAQEAVRRERKPIEGWMQLVLSLHFELKELARVAEDLKALISHFPKKTYFMQLSAVLAQLGDEARALAVMQLADEQGWLTSSSEVLNLAQYYAAQGIPIRTAERIEKGLAAGTLAREPKTLQLYATALLQARELDRAIEPLAAAAAVADSGDLYVQLGQLHLGREDWTRAAEALEKAIARGNLHDAGNTHLLLGVAYFSADKKPAARKAFEQAMSFERSRAAAEQWLRTMEKRR
jgi:tetratricopeptide (TPR) repeat protein